MTIFFLQHADAATPGVASVGVQAVAAWQAEL